MAPVEPARAGAVPWPDIVCRQCFVVCDPSQSPAPEVTMPNPTDLDYIIDGYMPTPAPTEEQLQQHAREAEQARMKALEQRIRHLEQALRTAGRVLTPYLGSTGR
jgi:hypothetical protein